MQPIILSLLFRPPVYMAGIVICFQDTVVIETNLIKCSAEASVYPVKEKHYMDKCLKCFPEPCQCFSARLKSNVCTQPYETPVYYCSTSTRSLKRCSVSNAAQISFNHHAVKRRPNRLHYNDLVVILQAKSAIMQWLQHLISPYRPEGWPDLTFCCLTN